MVKYNIKYKDDYLAHAGKKGMKWGYNDGQKNGKRTAITPVSNPKVLVTPGYAANPAAAAAAAAAYGVGDFLIRRGVQKYWQGYYKKPMQERRRLMQDKENDTTRYKKRLKKNVLDRYGTTLAKYGLNSIGYGNIDDSIERGVKKVKKKAKAVVDKFIGKKSKPKPKPKPKPKTRTKVKKNQNPFGGVQSKIM